ncbi:universal stress protein [Ornithinimicrobium pekingense]|uniref:Universal stress protein n=1 Tax=Ornithinimicrobium pekingense TaxID=384677 RepID=A0ABQ2FBZ9_9MICO|nr:universal stress protein [Ornithinimicrobium pekingense]GGK79527.1 universal stress protein [Ornithinimicrobium pekingense]
MTILVGYIPTPEGQAALQHAIAQARKDDALLVVVNSSRGEAAGDPRLLSEEQLGSAEEQLSGAGVEHLVVQPSRGRSAADEVLAAADEHRADLIVIGLRRRSPVGKLILGSNSQRILLEATCPVLAVKPGGAA